jgi:hypothetical protein
MKMDLTAEEPGKFGALLRRERELFGKYGLTDVPDRA